MTVLRIQQKRVDFVKQLCVATPLTPGGSYLKQAEFCKTQIEKA